MVKLSDSSSGWPEQHMSQHKAQTGSLIGDMVYGANDGIVTTLAVVMAVAGAGLSNQVVLIMGLANLLADGWSMASGSYLSSKSRHQYEDRERQIEERAIVSEPEARLACLRQHYERKGLSGQLAGKLLSVVSQNPKLWVDELLACELGLKTTEHRTSPWRHATATLVAFILAGLLPLVSFLTNLADPFWFAAALSLAAFFLAGSLSSLVTGQGWWFSGWQMLLVGSLAGAVAYGVGFGLKHLMGLVA